MTRTVRDAIDAPKRMNEIQKIVWDMMVDAKLTEAECIALLEGMKSDITKHW